ncbi:MAG: hypothetical protein JW993_01535 [Sedimentisphaerales bacterium]|nr:hypothetical protein [Sedimentisphaerales bacterium]
MGIPRGSVVGAFAAFLVVASLSGSAVAAPTTMHVANTTVGNQHWSSVGLQFTVNPALGISVSELGVYDSGGDGISGAAILSTIIFDAAQTPLAQMTFAAGDAGMTFDAVSNYLFKPLAANLILTPGTYTMVSYGFDSANNEHNMNNGGVGPIFNDGGGLISFVQSVWGTGSDVPPTFPLNTGPPDYFDGPNMRFDAVQAPPIVPAPGALLLGSLGAGLVGWLRRRRAM